MKILQTTNKRYTQKEELAFENFLWDKRNRIFFE